MTTPDIDIQKNIVQKPNLPYLDSDNNYLVRYRVKTQDGNSSTVWSPVFRIKKQSVEPLFAVGATSVFVETKSHGQSFDVSWSFSPSIPEQIFGLMLDVYVKWNGETVWNFVTSTSTNSFSMPIPEAFQSTPTQVYNASFAVHLSTFKKDRLPTDLDTLIFVKNNIPTNAIYDAGSIV